MEDMQDIINEIKRLTKEQAEKTLVEMITNYDFLVGSIECKHRLMTILPEAATIICTPYIEDPTIVYAIKKYDIMDLLK